MEGGGGGDSKPGETKKNYVQGGRRKGGSIFHSKERAGLLIDTISHHSDHQRKKIMQTAVIRAHPVAGRGEKLVGGGGERLA